MPAMRPKKPRYIDGVQLADNLYPDPKKRPGYYLYVRPDGSKRTFPADSVEEANQLAEEANSLRDSDIPVEKIRPKREQLAFHVPRYTEYMEKINPDLTTKTSWQNRKWAFAQFANDIPYLSELTHDNIVTWWDNMTYHQQKARQAEFRRFFNWLMRQGLVPKLDYNPFTTSDDLPRLLLKGKPKKKRAPLTQEMFNKIYAAAPNYGYECLQIAMEISRYTTLREADICSLRWDKHVVDGKLRVVVGKSLAQRGEVRAERLEWELEEHPILKRSIDRAREMSMKHARCPYVISHRPRRRVWNQDKKQHHYQVTADRLSRMFNEVMTGCELSSTSFHEVRGLASTLYRLAGYPNSDIKDLMAHEHVSTTIGYQDPEALPYRRVTMRLAE
ncbi:MAG TPA: hypothetical protein DEG76_00760 [Pseudohongiella sp.]|nr:hypothetical protein [Pseudohongiella sp.]HBX35903.1 hypothetical protein [Pseudohongiella sp.]|tara:strand:+ start:343 stop:1506 length:1164 start_codon:yes stop_codon:yes gene_type:complete